MGKKDVIKPGHFKLAGKDRPAQDGGSTEMRKEEYASEKASETRGGVKPEPAANARKKKRHKAA